MGFNSGFKGLRPAIGPTPGVEGPELEAGHSSPSNAEGKSECSCIFAPPPYTFKVCMGKLLFTCGIVRRRAVRCTEICGGMCDGNGREQKVTIGMINRETDECRCIITLRVSALCDDSLKITSPVNGVRMDACV